MDTWSKHSKVPTYGLTLKIDYELVEVVVYEEESEPFGLCPHGSGARHHYHDSP